MKERACMERQQSKKDSSKRIEKKNSEKSKEDEVTKTEGSRNKTQDTRNKTQNRWQEAKNRNLMEELPGLIWWQPASWHDEIKKFPSLNIFHDDEDVWWCIYYFIPVHEK
jgi:hypothetical protein